MKEAHHFYPLLFYFRFPDPRYSVSRICFIILDLVTLTSTVLDQERFGWLARSSALTRLQHGGDLMLKTLEIGLPDPQKAIGEDRHQPERMDAQYRASYRTLEDAGLASSSPDAGRYMTARHKWETRILSVAPVLGYTIEDVAGVEHRQS